MNKNFWDKSELLNPEQVKERIEQVKKLLRKPKIITIESFFGKEVKVEYIEIQAMTENGAKKPPIFNYPGGGAGLFPCIEPFLYLDRRSIIISPLGHGNSSDIPNKFFQYFPLHGGALIIRVLKILGEKEVDLYGHSNADPIISKAAIGLKDYGIKVRSLIFVNPLGIRKISKAKIVLAFPIFGLLSRLFSLGHKHPLSLLKGAYVVEKKPFQWEWKKIWQEITKQWRKLCYEIERSSKPSLGEILPKLDSKIPVFLIQSKLDWASFHWPWNKSNKGLLEGYLPEGSKLTFIEIPGLHNVTLGRDSINLARVMARGLPMIVFSFGANYLPQIIGIFGRFLTTNI